MDSATCCLMSWKSLFSAFIFSIFSVWDTISCSYEACSFAVLPERYMHERMDERMGIVGIRARNAEPDSRGERVAPLVPQFPSSNCKEIEREYIRVKSNTRGRGKQSRPTA